MIVHVCARPVSEAREPIRILSADDVRKHGLRPEEYELLWVDVRDVQSEDVEWLRQNFHFHPVALEDVARRHQRAKIEEYPGYSFGVLYAARVSEPPSQSRRVTAQELQFFWGAKFLVTIHDGPFAEIDDLASRIKAGKVQPITQSGDRPLSAGDLAYRVMDAIIDGYFPVVDVLSEWSEEIEEEMFSSRRDQNTLQAIFSLKKELFQMRKVLGPSRDAVNVLLRRDHSLFGDEFYPYFQDIYDHTVRVIDSLDTYRDILSSALDTYLSFVSNDVNQTVKKMTAVTAILMVDALIAGIYGMNFAVIPELRWQFGYPYALALMLTVSVGLWMALRRIRWL